MSLPNLLCQKYQLRPPFMSFSVGKFKTLIEKRIIEANAEIRKDPNWQDMVDNEEERKRWSDMAASKFDTTPEDMEYIFAELQYYKELHESCQGAMTLGGTDMVWTKDIPTDDVLTMEVKHYAISLEVLAMTSADQGGSTVLMLIDPRLYSLHYKKTRLLDTNIISPEAALKVQSFGNRQGDYKNWLSFIAKINRKRQKDSLYYHLYDRVIDYKYCWLPTDIQVNEDGSVSINSYINNLHPIRHSTFYVTLAKALQRTIPLVEQVLTDLVHPTKTRAQEYNSECDTFSKPGRPLVPYSLRGTRLQVVVEMKNVVLTPHCPSHNIHGGVNPGSPDARIFATAIWFYDVENVSLTDMEFSDPVGNPENPIETSDTLEEEVFSSIYGPTGYSDSGYTYDQMAGNTEVKGGRIVCFPNLYQYSRPFAKLIDPSRPAHVKMLYFYFVHPGVRLPSTSMVAPQQKEWWDEEISSVLSRKLPAELCQMILKRVDSLMSPETARNEYTNGVRQHRGRPVEPRDSDDYYTCVFYDGSVYHCKRGEVFRSSSIW